MLIYHYLIIYLLSGWNKYGIFNFPIFFSAEKAALYRAGILPYVCTYLGELLLPYFRD